MKWRSRAQKYPFSREEVIAARRHAKGITAYDHGRMLMLRDDFEGAEAAYRTGDECGHGGAALGLGVLLRDRGELKEAEAAFRRAAACDEPKFADSAVKALRSMRRGA